MQAGGSVLLDPMDRPVTVQRQYDYMTMYKREPTKEISVSDFVRLGQIRHELLLHMKSSSTMDERWQEKERQLRKDTVGDPRSHYVLALLYCRSEELRRQLVIMETRLFEHRTKHDVQSVARANGIVPPEGESKTALYPVPFVQVLKLVEQRKCEVINGMALVPEDRLHDQLVQLFKETLEKRLEKIAEMYNRYKQDEMKSRQLDYMLAQVKIATGPEVKDFTVGNVTAETLPTLVNPSFPLCMSNLYSGLLQDSHLRHDGRQQFGLFLKGIGMTVESALDFWRKAFSKKVASDKFDKTYAYNIRHNYGLEGKRVKYPPMGCHTIIELPQPLANEHHGCPYKHARGGKLRQLVEQRLSSYIADRIELNAAVREILELSEGEHYQLACQRMFALTHDNLVPKSGLKHPNSYFRESFEYLVSKRDGKVLEVSNRMMAASSALLAGGFESGASITSPTAVDAEALKPIDPKAVNLLEGFDTIDLEDLVDG